MRVASWMVVGLGEPMILEERNETVGQGEALIEVAGCGVCHTDLAFYYDGVRTRHGLPLCLGHEVSGVVVDAGAGAKSWVGRPVVVPAVIPCGDCEACRAGRGSICPRQIFPGNDVHGGFGTHLKVPAKGLCAVPDLSDVKLNPAGVDLRSLSVIADAVSTPYEAILRSGLEDGDLAVFVGVGGVGGFGVQLAAALGAHVIAIDVDEARLAKLARHGASAAWNASDIPARELKAKFRKFADDRGIPSWRQKVFETSGTPSGQASAWGLLARGGYLGVVGYTTEPVEVRLSNLMALDAVAQGNWGCPPERYPEILELVLAGKIEIEDFVEERPLPTINQTFEDLRSHRVSGRPILVPEA